MAQRTALWLLLGGWLGSWGLFGLSVAPVAFRVLPSEAAGSIVGPILSSLHGYGIVAGLGLAALSAALGRGRLLTVLPLVLAAACAYSQFGLSSEIAEIRDGAFGPDGDLDTAARWGQLHRLSMGIYLGVSACVVAMVGLHASKDAPPKGNPSPS